MEPTYRLSTEVFALPYLGERIIYAPLRQASLLVNESAADTLGRIQFGQPVDETPENIEFFALLNDLGILSFDDEFSTFANEHDPLAPYLPTGCTLFLTTDCNLRCVYCYARGGDSPRELAVETAQAAIDLVVANAKDTGASEVVVAFHGGGEPTLDGDRVQACVRHAEAACANEGMPLVLAIATNGVMSKSTREFVGEHFNSVMVSMDGAPSVQDAMRPRANGASTFEAAARTLRYLSDKKCRLGVRVTVSDATVDELVSSVRCILDIGGAETIHVEPLFACGRSLGSGLNPPDPARFVELFRLARKIAACEGVDVIYSAARTGMTTDSFCEVTAPSFNVTPDGDVTACYEVSDARDARADVFVFGRFDPEMGSFTFDAEKIAVLRGLTVAAAQRCERCFCKYHCAGDCAAKRLYPGASQPLAGRCTITRRLTQDLIEETLMGAGEDVLVRALADSEADSGVVVLGEATEG